MITIITFESNGVFMIVRGRGLPRCTFPGFRDMRGYRAMYRDFAGAIREGRAPEMSLERARVDHRLMDEAYASAEASESGCGAGAANVAAPAVGAEAGSVAEPAVGADAASSAESSGS